MGDETKVSPRTDPSRAENPFETYKDVWNKYQDKRD
jgi:hypothetical protein